MKVSVTLNENGTNIIHMSNSFAKKGYFLNKIKYNKDDDSMSIYIKLLKHFVKGKEVFFGFYRTDGINLTNEEWLKYDKEIPEYFQKYGRYEPLVETVEKRGKIKIYSGYLTVGSLPVNEETFEMLPKVFHCYLETILFCPKIDWDTFVQSYRDYMKHGASEYIMDGYADFLFTYADSGVFSISFDTNVYDPKTAHKEINKIILKTGGRFICLFPRQCHPDGHRRGARQQRRGPQGVSGRVT